MDETAGPAGKTSKHATARRKETAQRVRKHREKMKAMGLKPVTIWVPDINSPEFKAQIARDIAIINADADSQLVMQQMLSVADFSDWV
ncbi:MAG: antitoxin MazE family protein [Rhodopseudomonas sp.]|uniref:antitoxin MazE family protein n=1 Tax=Rhodopseudomonas sp. TaxID=1078 RepID=UPI0017D156DC|nr:antitoxin MazE family protein [Rhodopseudomonas sp.]NVN88250.1 antitoxin MazE family protein [Rhodopseudomonas sp.]